MKAIRDPATGKSWHTHRELIDHIAATYHGYLRLTLPVLDELAARIARERVVPVTLTDRFEREFAALADLLQTHIAKQECWLFPEIRELREPAGETAWVYHVGAHIDDLMQRLARGNQEALDMVDRVENCLADPRWPRENPVVAQLIEDLRELRDNLRQHVRLETDVLFPHLRELTQAQALVL